MAVTWDLAERAFARYLLTHRRSKSTASSYAFNVRFFWARQIALGHDPLLITPDEFGDYITERIQTRALNTVNVDLAALRAFFGCAIAQGWRGDDPTQGVAVKRSETAPETPFTPTEIKALYDACLLARDKLIVKMLIFTGIRISECAGIEAQDIHWGTERILIHGKGDKERYVQPHASLIRELRLFVGPRISGPIWWTIPERGVRPLTARRMRANLYEAAIRAGLRNVHPHRFRTSFAIEMLRVAGGDLQAVQIMLGHSRIESTARYTAFDREQRALGVMSGPLPALLAAASS